MMLQHTRSAAAAGIFTLSLLLLLLLLSSFTHVHGFTSSPSLRSNLRLHTRFNAINNNNINAKHGHTLAILSFPRTSRDQIANEAVLLKAMSVTERRLSVVIRPRDQLVHRTVRTYVSLCVFIWGVFVWCLKCLK